MSSRTFIRLANRAIVGLAVSALRRQPAYERSDTALLLIGPQPDLLHDAATVCALTRLLTAFRAAGVPVIYAVAASPSPDNGIQFPTPSQRAILDDGLLNPGTIGAEIHPELAPKPGDLILAPHATLSAFAKTSLARRLSEAGTRRIVVAGARTDVEIDSTARDAAELGFQTTVFADGCIGTSTQTPSCLDLDDIAAHRPRRARTGRDHSPPPSTSETAPGDDSKEPDDPQLAITLGRPLSNRKDNPNPRRS